MQRGHRQQGPQAGQQPARRAAPATGPGAERQPGGEQRSQPPPGGQPGQLRPVVRHRTAHHPGEQDVPQGQGHVRVREGPRRHRRQGQQDGRPGQQQRRPRPAGGPRQGEQGEEGQGRHEVPWPPGSATVPEGVAAVHRQQGAADAERGLRRRPVAAPQEQRAGEGEQQPGGVDEQAAPQPAEQGQGDVRAGPADAEQRAGLPGGVDRSRVEVGVPGVPGAAEDGLLVRRQQQQGGGRAAQQMEERRPPWPRPPQGAAADDRGREGGRILDGHRQAEQQPGQDGAGGRARRTPRPRG